MVELSTIVIVQWLSDEVIKLTSSKYFDFELVYIEEIDFVFLSIFLGLLIEQFGLYRVPGY